MLSKYNDYHINMLCLVSKGGVEIYTYDMVNARTNRENEDIKFVKKNQLWTYRSLNLKM